MKKTDMIKRAANIAWPAVLESFFTQLASFIDSLMVSSLGADAVAAVGLTMQPKNVIFALFLAANISIAALVARRRGEDDKERANQIFATFLIFIVISATILGVIAVIFADDIIHIAGSERQTHGSAVLYFRVTVGTIVLNAIQTGINAAQRGAGNTKITMTTNMVGNSVNILLNYLLINGHLGFPALGIYGAAIATVLGVAVAAIMSIISVLRADSFMSLVYIIKNRIKPSIHYMTSIVKLGYSVFVEQVMMKVGFLLTAIIAAHQGTYPYAAHQVAMNIMGLSFSFGDGLQAAAVALIGMSLGAGKLDEAKHYGSICQIFGRFLSVGLSLACFFGGRTIYGLFFKETQIIEYGVQIMHVMTILLLLHVPQVITMGCLRGAGDTLFTAVVITISAAFVRTGTAYLFCEVIGLGIVGVWVGVIADQLVRFVFATIRYKRGKWVNIKI